MAAIIKDYIFIHIHRTGGNSVKTILKTDRMLEWGGLHVEAKQVKSFLGSKEWGKRFKFSFVRNPYSWLYSTYQFIKLIKEHPDNSFAEKGFYDFLLWLVNDGMKRKIAHDSNKYLTQTGFIYENNKLLVDFVGKTENFEIDMRKVCFKLGYDYKFWHINEIPYKENYQMNNSETSLINTVFAEDFENFNYKKISC